MFRYLVDNSLLGSDSIGLSYRQTRKINDRHKYEQARWGTTVVGSAVFEGWIQVGQFFLPMALNGHQVLVAQGEGWDAQFGCITCCEFGRLPSFCCRFRVGSKVRVKEPLMSNSKDPILIEMGILGTILDMDEEGDGHIKFVGIDKLQWIFRRNFHFLELVSEVPTCSENEKTSERSGETLAAGLSAYLPSRLTTPTAAHSSVSALSSFSVGDWHGSGALLSKFKSFDPQGVGLVKLAALEKVIGADCASVLAECLEVVDPKDGGMIRYKELIQLLFPGEKSDRCYTLQYQGHVKHPTRGDSQFQLDVESFKNGRCMISGQQEPVAVSQGEGNIVFDVFARETRLIGRPDPRGVFSGSVIVAGKHGGHFELAPLVSTTEHKPLDLERATSQQSIDNMSSNEARCPSCGFLMTWIDFRAFNVGKVWTCFHVETCGSQSETRGQFCWSCSNCSASVCCRCGPKLDSKLLHEMEPLRPVSNYIGIHDWVTMGARSLMRASGRFYHEVELGAAMSAPQVGWLTSQFATGNIDGLGVGSDEHGWAVDGLRHLKWHCGCVEAPWPRDWQAGDIIGCLIDIDSGSMQFSLNGCWVDRVSMSFDASGRSFYPAVSMSGDFIFHMLQSEWCHPPAQGACEAWESCALCGQYRRPEGSKLLRAGARVQMVGDVLSSSNVKVELRRGDYGCIYQIDQDGDALIDFNEHPDKREWVFASDFDKLRVLESRDEPINLSELDNSGPSLLGTWLHAAGQFTITETENGSFLFYGASLQKEGQWVLCTLPATGVSYRIKLSKRGNAIAWQERVSDGATWEAMRFGVRQGHLADGAPLVSIQQTQIWTSTGSTRSVGSVPTGTRLVAAGPPSNMSAGMVPIRPEGAVELRCVRLQEEFDEQDIEPPFEGVQGTRCDEGKYTELPSIWNALSTSDVVLIRGSWMRSCSERGEVLPCRQKLPTEAIWPPTELQASVTQRQVELVAISYCWASPTHPDPEGRQLFTMATAIDQRLRDVCLPLDDVAVFIDWCSLHQDPRTPDEEAAFKRGRDCVNLWYAHSEVIVWLVTGNPGSSLSYHSRGWPTFEYATSGLQRESAKLLDLGAIRDEDRDGLDDDCHGWLALRSKCITKRLPPTIPAAFSTSLEEKVFTKPEDKAFVNRMYEETFHDVMGSSLILDFGSLGWEPADIFKVAESLPFCHSLQQLRLSDNNIGEEGAEALAAQLPACARLADLRLRNVRLGNGGAEALSGVLPKLTMLAVLHLQDNNITAQGASAMAAALPNCGMLSVLFMAGNAIGMGVSDIARVLGQCKSLRELHVENNGLSIMQKRLLQARWTESGRPGSSLDV